MADKLLYGLQVTIIGMGIVFVILYIISLMLDIMRPLFHKPSKKQGPPSGGSTTETKAQPSKTRESDSSLTLAVIAAAVSAAANIPLNRLNVLSIRRLPQTTPAWAMAARMDNPATRLK